MIQLGFFFQIVKQIDVIGIIKLEPFGDRGAAAAATIGKFFGDAAL